MGENRKNGKNEKKILALGFNNFYCIFLFNFFGLILNLIN